MQDTADIIGKMAQLKNLEIEGIFTHLALADRESDQKQYGLFSGLILSLEKAGINIPVKHVCDSIGMVRYPEYHMDMVRTGAFLFGAGPKDMANSQSILRTSLTFKTRIAQIKEIRPGEGVSYDFTFVSDKVCRVGTLPVGYADGYMRCLSNKGFVSVCGKRARVIGLICMDQCMIDLTDIPEASEGDEVVLVGGNREAAVPVIETAELAGTNRNEILSVISRRVPRVYIRDGKVVDTIDYLI
ncbi:MAG TPA: alanine racemase [Ruminiclostridium sp.]|nr:alanine racemase [Ruminiclostridium sp.]